MNPWTASFEEHRQNILGEAKKKSDKKSSERWQDDDCDGKWYEKSDVDGKISDREKKEKKKHYKENKNCCKKCGSYEHTTAECTVKEDITLTRGDYGSRNVPGSAWHTAAKRNFKGYTAGGGLTPQFKLANSYEPEGKIIEGNQRDPEGQEKDRKRSKQSDPSKDNFTGISGSIATIMKQNAAMKKAAKKKEKKESVEINHIDGSKTEIVDVVRRPAMVAAPKLSNWKEEMQWQDEALKPEKLDVKETGVKNKIQINPEIKTESKKQKYDNTKSPDYKEKKDKLAKKHGGKKNIKGHPQYEHHQKDANGNTIPHDLDEGIGKWVQDKFEKTFKAADRVSDAMDKNPITSLIKKGAKALVSPVNNNKGSNYTNQGKIANSYEPEGEMIEEKKKLSNGSPLINRVSKWSKTMKKEEVISERDRIKYLKSGNKDAYNQPPNKVIKHGVNGVNYNLVQNASSKTVTSSYEPEGDVIQEKPGDGWIGPTVGGVGIPNPIRITKDIVDKANRATQKKVNTANQISPGSASMPNVNYFNKAPSAATVKLGLNSYEPEGEVIAEKDYHSGQGEKIQKRTLAWMKKKGQKGAPGLDAMKARTAEHEKRQKASRGKKQSQNNSYEPQGEMLDEKKKKKDDTYLETDFKKRLKNNEKARKELQKGPQMKNPHLESIEVVVELNRYGKETGKATGSLNKRPGSRVEKGGSGKTAVNVVRTGIRKQTGKPEGQRKTRKKGEKTADMKGPSPKLKQGIKNLQKKRDLDKKARDAGYTNTQDYVNVQARYPDK